ncbi:sugar phosphate isomerase/epimerase family protein [Sphingomonas jatrophae]|uniref:Sugar phosphate isomerase/epimerase n=1 Tax=Sphingomonas jatrophae TaxID=1166337 RepID=A0A1I6M1Q4_9SPHN|nr:TIM barrel protein [Sphingomonas jatrophae]SFS09649.1 Sugar phosphate isomerase/epimerase [Sphingomonas jatrophae]
MRRDHPISMAAGIMPEATPVQLVEAAAAAGFDYGGMWMEAADWTSATTRAVSQALRDTGLRLLDIEVVWLRPGPPDPNHVRLIEVGAELGARNVLAVSSDPDRSATIDKLGALMERGQAMGIRINLEFGAWSAARTIHEAMDLLRQIDSPAAGLLIDTLHWSRSGGTLADLDAVPPRWLGYAQLCDAPFDGPSSTDPAALLTEAIDDRLPTGGGGLPLRDFLAHLPAGLPLAIEERSRPLRERWPDLTDRARAVARTTRMFLDGLAADHTAPSSDPRSSIA